MSEHEEIDCADQLVNTFEHPALELVLSEISKKALHPIHPPAARRQEQTLRLACTRGSVHRKGQKARKPYEFGVKSAVVVSHHAVRKQRRRDTGEETSLTKSQDLTSFVVRQPIFLPIPPGPFVLFLKPQAGSGCSPSRSRALFTGFTSVLGLRPTHGGCE